MKTVLLPEGRVVSAMPRALVALTVACLCLAAFQIYVFHRTYRWAKQVDRALNGTIRLDYDHWAPILNRLEEEDALREEAKKHPIWQ